MASEPLSADVRETVMPNQVTFVDQRRLILSLRYDRDGRLCAGDHGPMRDRFALSDYDRLKKRVLAEFALGKSETALPFPVTTPKKFPLHQFHRLGVSIGINVGVL